MSNPSIEQQVSLTPYRLKPEDLELQQVFFVSFCVWHSQNLLGKINHDLRLNELGQLVTEEWIKYAASRSELTFDSFILMPNHFHAIIAIPKETQAKAEGRVGDEARVGKVVQNFKLVAQKRVNDHKDTPDAPLWQPDFHFRPIGNYRSLEAFRRYIADNPASWPVDPLNPESPNPHPSCYVPGRNSS